MAAQEKNASKKERLQLERMTCINDPVTLDGLSIYIRSKISSDHIGKFFAGVKEGNAG